MSGLASQTTTSSIREVMPELINRVLNHWHVPFSKLLHQLRDRQPAEFGGFPDGHLPIRIQPAGRDRAQIFLDVLKLILRDVNVGIVNDHSDVEVARSVGA